jgi:hypothetical protein
MHNPIHFKNSEIPIDFTNWNSSVGIAIDYELNDRVVGVPSPVG